MLNITADVPRSPGTSAVTSNRSYRPTPQRLSRSLSPLPPATYKELVAPYLKLGFLHCLKLPVYHFQCILMFFYVSLQHPSLFI